jgi:hypothetical protein
MIKAMRGKLGIIVIGAILGAGPYANAVAQDQDSGFLRDYSRMQESTDSAGKTIRAWVSPKLSPDNYNALLIDPLVFYPEPRPSEKVSAEALQQMLAYSNDVLKRTLSKRFNVVDRPGPGVLRLRVAFTSVAAKGEGLKPYQLVPMAFVVTMAKGGPAQRALIVAEVEATDSVSGQLMGMRVRTGTGERLAKIGDKEAITLQTVKPLLDEMAGQAFPELQKYVKAK